MATLILTKCRFFSIVLAITWTIALFFPFPVAKAQLLFYKIKVTRQRAQAICNSTDITGIALTRDIDYEETTERYRNTTGKSWVFHYWVDSAKGTCLQTSGHCHKYNGTAYFVCDKGVTSVDHQDCRGNCTDGEKCVDVDYSPECIIYQNDVQNAVKKNESIYGKTILKDRVFSVARTKGNPVDGNCESSLPVGSSDVDIMSSTCPCICSATSQIRMLTGSKKKEFESKMFQVSKEITIPKNNLSSTIRRKTSAPDDRTSSKGIGIVSMVLLSVVFGGLVAADIGILVSQMKVMYQNMIGSRR